MSHPQLFTIASVADTLADLKRLPLPEQATALLRRLTHIYPQVRNTGGLHKGNFLLPNDPYGLATGFDISENMPARIHLLGTPWNRLVNEGYLVDPQGNGFFSISDEGMGALGKFGPDPLAPPAPVGTGDGRSPRAFISYSWDSEPHRAWVATLAKKLQGEHGVEVILDQWHLTPGGDKSQFMESSITSTDFVLVVCTPEYARKSNSRTGGVGYEAMILSTQLARQIAQGKFIPVLRAGDWDSSLPIWIQSKLGVDLRGDPYPADQYELLLRVLHKALIRPPKIAPRPSFLDSASPVVPPIAENAVSAVVALDNKIAKTKSGSGRSLPNNVRPKLFAQFQEENGEIVQIYEEGDGLPSICMDLWVEDAPANTQIVYFEMTDTGVAGRKWSKKRTNGPRAFLADDVTLWGDVEIWARGTVSSGAEWKTKSSLYDALIRHYGGHEQTEQIRQALDQIKNN